MTETMIDHLAFSLGMDPEVVKATNLYKNGHMTLVGQELTHCNMPMIWERKLCSLFSLIINAPIIFLLTNWCQFFDTIELYQSAEVDRRKKEIADYNKV